MLQTWLRRYEECWRDPAYRVRILFSTTLFLLSMVFIFNAIGYANIRASNHVTDIVLSNIPAFNVGWLFVGGTLLFFFTALALTFFDPRRIPFTLSALALFFFIRGIFISITHLAPFPVESTFDVATVFNRIFNGGDQFFSGHTGAPFLFALLFWNHLRLRYIFLGWSIFFATIVLLGHLHYSIDVLAAFFITYSIYRMAVALFPKLFELFKKAT